MRLWLAGFVLASAVAAPPPAPDGRGSLPGEAKPAGQASVSAAKRRGPRLVRWIRRVARAEPALAERLSSWGMQDSPRQEPAAAKRVPPERRTMLAGVRQ